MPRFGNENPEGINYTEIKALITQAFDKAKSESRRNSKPGWYQYISDNLKNTSPSEKTLERYYKKYIEGKSNEIGQPKEDIIDEISIWLGYKGFAEFCHTNFPGVKGNYSEEENVDGKERRNETNNKTSLALRNVSGGKNYLKMSFAGLGIAAMAGLGTYWGMAPEKNTECMYWGENHYLKIDCSEEIHPETSVVPYDEQLFKYFFQIEPTDTTTFFKAGNPVVWYVKVDGKPEFFSADGRHPINGKELKKVTPYIVNKYVLKRE